MNKIFKSYLLAFLFFLKVLPCAGGQVDRSPAEVLRHFDGRHGDLKADAYVSEEEASPFVYLAFSMPDAAEPSKSETPPAPESVHLSLLEAIRYSLEGNQDIQVVSYTPKQAREEVVKAESVYDPSIFTDASLRRDPNLQSSVTDVVTEDKGVIETGIKKPLKTGGSLSAFLGMGYGNLNNADFEREFKYTFGPGVELRQPLLKNLGSKEEQTAIKIANYHLNISEQELRQKVIEIATLAARSYWQLFLFRELVQINQNNVDMAEEVYRREAVRLAAGMSKQLDVERARSNAHARRGILLKSKEQFWIFMDRLKLLMNRSNLRIDSKVEVVPVEEPQTAPIDVDEMEAIEKALKYRPEIETAKQRLAIRRVEAELSSHQRLPQLDVFGRYHLNNYGKEFSTAVDDTGLNEDDTWAVGLNFEWPIGNRSARSLYRKKSLEHEQAIAQVERVRDQIQIDVKEVLLAIVLAKGEIESTKQAKEAAEKVVAAEFARFDIGETTNEELLRAQDLLAATSRTWTRAIIDYNIALAELARAQGVLPRGISIETSKWPAASR